MVRFLRLLPLCLALTIGLLIGAVVQANPTVTGTAHKPAATSPEPNADVSMTPLSPPAAAATCGVELCQDARCCQARCACNAFKSGKCQKLAGAALSCWCSNDLAKWQTAPGQCK